MPGLKRLCAALALIAALLPQAAAQPGGKVMRIVVPFAAGGAREVLARTFYSELGAALGQTAIIDNRPGAGGAIGTADANNDVLAARSHAVIVPNVGAIPFVKDGRIRLLGVTSPKRSAFLPGVPPVAESVPGYGFDSWFGLLAPAKTPKAAIARINAGVAKLLRDPVILGRLAGQGVEPRPLSPEAFERLLREDYEEMAK